MSTFEWAGGDAALYAELLQEYLAANPSISSYPRLASAYMVGVAESLGISTENQMLLNIELAALASRGIPTKTSYPQELIMYLRGVSDASGDTRIFSYYEDAEDYIKATKAATESIQVGNKGLLEIPGLIVDTVKKSKNHELYREALDEVSVAVKDIWETFNEL